MHGTMNIKFDIEQSSMIKFYFKSGKTAMEVY